MKILIFLGQRPDWEVADVPGGHIALASVLCLRRGRRRLPSIVAAEDGLRLPSYANDPEKFALRS